MSQITWRPKHKMFPWQARVEASGKRFKVIKGGRRSGKTIYADQWQATQACEMERGEHLYVAPTQKQAAEISWDEYLDILGPDVIKRVERRDGRITLKNDATIIMRGSDKLDLQRGKKYRSLVMEEAAFQKAEVFDRILRPTLIDYRSPAVFISSPKKGWFTKMYNKYEDGHDAEYACFKVTIYDNPLISREEIDKIRALTSEQTFQTEYMSEELEFEGQVYTEFDASRNVFGSGKWQNHKLYPAVVGADWGFEDSTGIVWMTFSPEGYCLVSREHLRAGWDVRRHAEVVARHAPDYNLPWGNYVMDKSAFRRDGGSATTVADLFKNELGFYFQRSYNGPKDYGTDIVKRFLRGDGETPWLYVSQNCPELIRAFDDYEWEQHEPDILAALRYGLVHAVSKRLTSLHDRIESLKTVSMKAPAQVGDLELVRREKSRLGASWGWDDDYGVPIGDLANG